MNSENCPFTYKPLPLDAPVVFSMCEPYDPKRLAAEIAKLLYEYTEKKRELEALREMLRQAVLLFAEKEEA